MANEVTRSQQRVCSTNIEEPVMLYLYLQV